MKVKTGKGAGSDTLRQWQGLRTDRHRPEDSTGSTECPHAPSQWALFLWYQYT